MNKRFIIDILKSWNERNGSVNNTADILSWISELNNKTYVDIRESSLCKSNFWFYDDCSGEVLNQKRSFFSIIGMRFFENNEFIKEQPIILQSEIGYLGIICKKINGVLNFLMQAKIEPGNVNYVQISPTIQATKSNFLRVHGGDLPTYFELFAKSYKYCVVYDQIQSEQASRFYKKRNRNMILYLDEIEIDIYPNFKWMTLGQIKELMKIDNLVNMDTRTVLSGLPFLGVNFTHNELKEIDFLSSNGPFFSSIFNDDPQSGLPVLYQKLNNFKMFQDVRVEMIPLSQLFDWTIDEYGITCKQQSDFIVRYYDIEIAGREVQHWMQPLFKAMGIATFGLLSRIHSGKREYLVKIKPEIGSFDKAEIGPCIQWEPTHDFSNDNMVDSLFRKKLELGKGFITDVILSEEGGRFFHEQNRNIILNIEEREMEEVPDEYIWTDYSTLCYLVQINNCLNIQLRNLMSLIDFL